MEPAAAAASDESFFVAPFAADVPAAPSSPRDHCCCCSEDDDRAPETAIAATATGNPASVRTLLTAWHLEEIRCPNDRAITNCAAMMSTFLHTVPLIPHKWPWSPCSGSIWQRW